MNQNQNTLNITLDPNTAISFSTSVKNDNLLLQNIHPGEILLEEFLNPLGISEDQFARDTKIPHTALSQIIKGQQPISPEIAKTLAAYFKISRQFWLGLQDDYDAEDLKRKNATNNYHK